MDQDRIDASAGLAFSLVLFEQYRKNGLLQAELHHVPGFRGRWKGCLHLVEGKAVSCYLENMQGQRYPVGVEMLTRLDRERGPFEWTLVVLPAPPSLSAQADSVPRSIARDPVPKQCAPLDLGRLHGWTYRQKMMVAIVFNVVDGRRSIEAIKADVPLPGGVVEEALRVLLALKVIVLLS